MNFNKTCIFKSSRRFIFYIVLLSILILPFNAHASLREGLIGWWKFDDGSGASAVDSSGYGNNGDLTGHAPTWTTGVKGGALSFNGSSQYVSIPGTRTLTSATFSAWVYRTGANAWGAIIDSRSPDPETGMTIINDGTTLGYDWLATTWTWNSGLTVPLNTWAFVVITVQPTQAVAYVYSSSGLFSAINIAAHTSAVLGDVYIGQDPFGGRFFPGLIDDVRMYNRALNAGEVKDLYQSDSAHIANASIQNAVLNR